MRTTVVIPTYNERDTLSTLVEQLLALPRSDLNVLVVDDGSPDGTGTLADDLARRHPERVAVLHRPRKEGLGRAYIAGFDRARADGADVIVEMDGDLSHDPAELPRLLDATAHADVVLGSRYVQGGSVVNWDMRRRAISRLGNWYARLVLAMPVHDLTSGYKAFRREVLDAVNYHRAHSIGYNFQIELTVLAARRGFRIVEIPIRFTERRAGRSKFQKRMMLESFWKILLLRFRSPVDEPPNGAAGRPPARPTASPRTR